ncbi:MAG: hypothetical protein WDW38_003290 [Sanguina aurantia]
MSFPTIGKRLLVGSGILVTAVTGSFYAYFRSHQQLPSAPDGSPSQGTATFDAIASIYDAAIGQEEFYMGYGFLRGWLLKRYAQGKVLEISAGTGRNIPYYPYENITSLTLSDLSQPMLDRSETKYFDELKMIDKHQGTLISFQRSDAHCMSTEPIVPAIKPSISNSTPASTTTMSGDASSKPLPMLTGQGGSLMNIFYAISGGPFTDQHGKSASAGKLTSTTSASSPSTAAGEVSDPSHPTVASSSASSASDESSAAVSSTGGTPGSADPGHHTHAQRSACCSGFAQRCRDGKTEAGLSLTKFPSASFDTVVDTFGLCSHEDPVLVLREAARVCKPGGLILLLEHGKSSSDWLNSQLDESASQHHNKWGCWWNRDIMQIVGEAGLALESVNRWHFGTTYILVARPAPVPALQ